MLTESTAAFCSPAQLSRVSTGRRRDHFEIKMHLYNVNLDLLVNFYKKFFW